MSILKPGQKLLTILKRTREATLNELTIKTKINETTIYSLLKKLEEQGRVNHRYIRGDYTKRYVKHYRLTGNEVKSIAY
jgi:DNA-binding PadR family transcriptional regulator